MFRQQIPLSGTAGMVARGEAIGGAEAEAHEAARRGTRPGPPFPDRSERSPEHDAD